MQHSHPCTSILVHGLTCAHTLTCIPAHTRTHTHSPTSHRPTHTCSLNLQSQSGAGSLRGCCVTRHPRGTAVVPFVQVSKGQEWESQEQSERGKNFLPGTTCGKRGRRQCWELRGEEGEGPKWGLRWAWGWRGDHWHGGQRV